MGGGHKQTGIAPAEERRDDGADEVLPCGEGGREVEMCEALRAR
eukprot:COSAG01_NODE_41736_length_447_cov_30.508621_1_plen_43_part_01